MSPVCTPVRASKICPCCEGRVEYLDVENCTGADHEGNPSYSWTTGYFCMDNENCEHYHEPIDSSHYDFEE